MLSKLRGAYKRFIEEFSFIRGNLLVLIISWCFFHFAFGMEYPYESPYIRALGASPFIIGLLGSIGSFILALVRIPGSYIADKYGRKQIIVTMTFGVAIAYLFYAFAPDWRFILIGIIISNFCLIYQPALEAITADSIPPRKRGLGYTLSNIIPELPSIAAPVLAGYLIERYKLVPGMRIVYLLVFLLSLSAAIFRLFFLKETLKVIEKFKFSDLKRIYRESIKSILEAWREVDFSIKILTIILMISAFEDQFWMYFASLYVFDIVRISKFDWGFVMMVNTIARLAFGYPLGKLIDFIGKRKSIILAYLIFIPGTILFITSRSTIQLILVFILFASGGILLGPSLHALLADLTPRVRRGRIMGVIGTLNLLATIPASTIAGLLYQIKPQLTFIFTIFTGSINLLLTLLFIREPKVKEE